MHCAKTLTLPSFAHLFSQACTGTARDAITQALPKLVRLSSSSQEGNFSATCVVLTRSAVLGRPDSRTALRPFVFVRLAKTRMTSDHGEMEKSTVPSTMKSTGLPGKLLRLVMWFIIATSSYEINEGCDWGGKMCSGCDRRLADTLKQHSVVESIGRGKQNCQIVRGRPSSLGRQGKGQEQCAEKGVTTATRATTTATRVTTATRATTATEWVYTYQTVFFYRGEKPSNTITRGVIVRLGWLRSGNKRVCAQRSGWGQKERETWDQKLGGKGSLYTFQRRVQKLQWDCDQWIRECDVTGKTEAD